jgi:hypothetical protein
MADLLRRGNASALRRLRLSRAQIDVLHERVAAKQGSGPVRHEPAGAMESPMARPARGLIGS